MNAIIAAWETLAWRNYEALLAAGAELIETEGMVPEEAFDTLLAAGAELIEFEGMTPKQALTELIQ